MKKILFLAAFAFVSLAATSARALSTISPTPDRPHQTSPPVGPADQTTGQTRSNDQKQPNGRAHYKNKKMPADATSPTDRKEDRKEMKMRKKADKAGSM